MLSFIDNPKKSPHFAQFNAKIQQYNLAIENQNLSEALLLLQEIHFFQQQLTTLALDNLFDPSINPGLRGIFDWKGVSQELTHWLDKDDIPISALMLEMTFNRLTGISDVNQTVNLWRSQSEPSWFDNISFLWGSVKNPKIDNYIKDLLNLHDEHGSASLNYFYGLQKVKFQLLQTINLESLSAAELIPYQTLLKQINGQLNAVILNVPTLRDRYTSHETISRPLRKDLENASPDQKERIAAIFSSVDFNQPPEPELTSEMDAEELAEYSEQMMKNKEEIQGILPNLQHMYVHKISSANNKTWILQQDEIGERTALRVEQPSPAGLIQRLRASPVNEFLSQTYATCISEYNPYPILISEFAEMGDLRSHRKDMSKFNKEGVILQQAVKDIGKMAEFCAEMLEQGAMHPDLKLSNFLLSADHRIFINDMKAFKSVNEAGKILARDTIVTPPFAPPEYQKSLALRHKNEGTPIELDADKFMSYQLGLALYDHLVLPSDPEWSTRKLDFSYPIFQSPQGKKLQTLIKLLTLENPDNRLGIQYAIKQLAELQKPLAKLHMTLQVKTLPSDNGEREIEPDDKNIGKASMQNKDRTNAHSPTQINDVADLSDTNSSSAKNPKMK